MYELLCDGETVKAECDSCYRKELCTLWSFTDSTTGEQSCVSTALCDDCEGPYLEGFREELNK